MLMIDRINAISLSLGLSETWCDVELQVNLANDHRYMPQIVSSAIVNAPPPEGVIKTLHLCSQAHSNIDKATKVWIAFQGHLR